jgi:hypothetical protein
MKILLLFLSVIYILSFLEVNDVERNQNYGNEAHSYVVTSDASVSVKNIDDCSPNSSQIIFNDGIDEQLLVHSQLYTNILFNPTGYLPQKIYITNSVFLI